LGIRWYDFKNTIGHFIVTFFHHQFSLPSLTMGCDALVFQPKDLLLESEISYNDAAAIIRRIPDVNGDQWSFHTLITISDQILLGTGVYGPMCQIIKAAQYQFGDCLKKYDLIPTDYTHPLFPIHLIPPVLI
jgi:hypothetical protein